MTALFRRVVNVTIAPKTKDPTLPGLAGLAAAAGMALEFTQLDCVFSVKKSLKATPNTCELKIFNLNEDSRKVFETAERLVLRLDAGYPNAIAQLYFGEIYSAHTHWEGPDCITEISTGDNEKERGTTRIHLTVGPKVPADVVLMQMAKEFQKVGVGIGNAPEAAVRLKAKGLTPFGPGSVVSGNLARAFTDLCRSGDLEWSIQDGVLQILDRGKALENSAVLLSADTGLVGSPTVDNKGIVSASALIQPDLLPGRKVVFDAKSLQGAFKITEAEYQGDTAGNEWHVKFKAKRY